jgi:hypothetical protein
MWGKREKPSIDTRGGPALAPVGENAHPDPHAQAVCCGVAMEPRLARARDRLGQLVFVAVWRCTRCGRTVA